MLTVGICSDDTSIYINHDEPGNFHRLATLTVHDAENLAQKLLACVVHVRSKAFSEQLLKDLNAVFDNYEPGTFHNDDLGVIARSMTKRLNTLISNSTSKG